MMAVELCQREAAGATSFTTCQRRNETSSAFGRRRHVKPM